jgi:hypothetical protein
VIGNKGTKPKACFQQVAKDAFEDLINKNYNFYKKVSEDDEVSKEFFARLFEWHVDGRKKAVPQMKR